jgi:molecular chaperone GrpE (heat shock protein)
MKPEDQKNHPATAFLRTVIPTVINKKDHETSVRIGQLYEPRDLETRVNDDLRRKQELRDQYTQFFEQNRYKRIRREFKELADKLMETNQEKVGKEREIAIRDLMNASFA